MSVRPVLVHPDPMLRRACDPVTAVDADVARLIDDLIETMRAHGAIGLSAPQIGDLRRVAVLEAAGEGAAEGAGQGNPARVFVDPQVVAKRGAWGLVQESCLSVPGVKGNVLRDTRVRVRALDREGAPFEVELAGMDAVCVQHEIDHLAGVLFVDRLSVFRRLALRARGALAGERRAAAVARS
ncbi:peptide deformylase [Salinarimonas sp.]|uniref:peptide deformylase n=1 Tax=Salinarimonas sp. TaxID=2766526 RepID=UPI0032D8E247